MRYECEVIQDLMPLYVDGTASERSRTMVEEHTEECAPCREMLEEMQQVISVEPPKAEMVGLVQRLRWNRSKRAVLLVLLGVVLAIVLAGFGIRVWTYYYNDFSMLTPFDMYSLELDDQEGLHVILKPKNGQQQLLSYDFDEHTGELYIWSKTTRLPRKAGAQWIVSGGGLYYHPDYGYVWHDRGGFHWVNRIYRGAPDSWYADGEEPEREVLAEGMEAPDTDAATEWLSTLRNPEFVVREPHMEK